jgi:hypothetical protein
LDAGLVAACLGLSCSCHARLLPCGVYCCIKDCKKSKAHQVLLWSQPHGWLRFACQALMMMGSVAVRCTVRLLLC